MLDVPVLDASKTLEWLVVAAALCHVFQLPAMWIAAHALGWRSSGPPTEMNRRIERVLTLTVPTVAAVSVVLLLANHEMLATSTLGRGFLVIVVGLLLLMTWRRMGAPEQRFARRRLEIVFLLVGLGLLVGFGAEEVVRTALGRELCATLAALYLSRLAVQLVYYRKIWPGGSWMQAGQWGLVALFGLQFVLYAVVAFGGRA